MNPEEKNPLKQIRTFQGDVAEALERQKGSLVSIQQAERGRNPSSRSLPSETSKRRTELFYLFLGSLVLFVLGATGAWFGYNEFLSQRVTPVGIAPANRFVSVNNEFNLLSTENSRDALIASIRSATANYVSGEIHQVNIPFSTSDFLLTLESKAPGNLVRAFDPLFMFGTFGQSNFLIIKLASFENAFSGMLAWEKDMPEDLGPLFTTVSLLQDLQQEPVFTDLSDQNKDVRVLYLESEPILLYSFFDNSMLIVTDSIETLRTLVDRLALEKLSR